MPQSEGGRGAVHVVATGGVFCLGIPVENGVGGRDEQARCFGYFDSAVRRVGHGQLQRQQASQNHVHRSTSPVVDTKPFALQWAVLNKAGGSLPGEKVTYSSNPSDVVSVTDAGECRCLKSGDATVLVAGGGLSSLVGVKCRLVSGIDAPREARFVVGEAVEGFHMTALSESNSPLADVPVALSSSDEHVLRVENQGPVPVGVGKATLRATAGGFTASTEVTVVQTVASNPLLLNDGERHSWTLSAGRYEIEVKVAAAQGGSDGVTVAWLGSDCPDQYEKQLHQIRGRVADTSALTFENPTMLGMGSAVNGYVKIVRVP